MGILAVERCIRCGTDKQTLQTDFSVKFSALTSFRHTTFLTLYLRNSPWMFTFEGYRCLFNIFTFIFFSVCFFFNYYFLL